MTPRPFLLILLLTFWATGIVRANDLSPPPGPPGPAMKSLDEVEPRIPISEVPLIIGDPGSYYLTGNLTVGEGETGISVRADNVTIDMMGYTLVGDEGSVAGIWVLRSEAITIRNGVVRDFGGDGIRFEPGLWLAGALLERLHVAGNKGHGIQAGNGESFVVRDCIVRGNALQGIWAGNNVMIERCLVVGNGGTGIRVSSDSVIRESVSSRNGGKGIQATGSIKIQGCVISRNAEDGILVNLGPTNSVGLLRENVVNGNGSRGIFVFVGGIREDAGSQEWAGQDFPVSRIEANHVAHNEVGIEIESPLNVVVRNSARGNTAENYVIAEGNQAGPIGTMAEVGEHPWANLSY